MLCSIAVRHTAHYDGLITGVRKRLLSCKEESVNKKIKISNNEDNTWDDTWTKKNFGLGNKLIIIIVDEIMGGFIISYI